MYDKLKTAKTISDIESEFEKLEIFGLSDKNYDVTAVYASSMAILSIITRSLDLVEEIIFKNEWGMPQKYKQYFTLLGEKGIIDKKLQASLEKLAEWRNTFAHEYFNTDKNKILIVKKEIYCIKELLLKIKKEVARDKDNSNK